MDIAQYANYLLGGYTNKYLLDLPVSRSGTNLTDKFHNIIGSEEKTETIIASFFWQIYLHSSEIQQKLGRFDNPDKILKRSEKVIVNHGTNYPEYNLMIFDPQYDRQEPTIIKINPKRIELENGFLKWKKEKSTGSKEIPVSLSQLVEITDFNLIWEIKRNQEFKIIWLKEPSRLYTADVPNIAIGVAPSLSGNITSTVGVFTTNNKNQAGCTVCFHALRDHYGKGKVTSGLQIEVNGKPATIRSVDEISDSCFAELSSPLHSIQHTKRTHLSGVTPRQHESAEFTGISSQTKGTVIIGWSYDLPFVAPYNQLKVFTTPKTNPGDSGAPLIDSEGKIIGFSFYRTGINEPVEKSAWIWADSVFQFHGLT